jgi:hypothetical protein
MFRFRERELNNGRPCIYEGHHTSLVNKKIQIQKIYCPVQIAKLLYFLPLPVLLYFRVHRRGLLRFYLSAFGGGTSPVFFSCKLGRDFHRVLQTVGTSSAKASSRRFYGLCVHGGLMLSWVLRVFCFHRTGFCEYRVHQHHRAWAVCGGALRAGVWQDRRSNHKELPRIWKLQTGEQIGASNTG